MQILAFNVFSPNVLQAYRWMTHRHLEQPVLEARTGEGHGGSRTIAKREFSIYAITRRSQTIYLLIISN